MGLDVSLFASGDEVVFAGAIYDKDVIKAFYGDRSLANGFQMGAGVYIEVHEDSWHRTHPH